VVLSLEIQGADPLLDLSSHAAQVTPLHIESHVDLAGCPFTLDFVGSGYQSDLGGIRQRHMRAQRRLDRKLAHRRDVVTDVARSPGERFGSVRKMTCPRVTIAPGCGTNKPCGALSVAANGDVTLIRWPDGIITSPG